MFSSDPPESPPPEEEGPFEEILLLCLRRILEDENPRLFLRWAQRRLVPLLEHEQPDLEPGEARRLAFLLARAVWNATPLPSQGFCPDPLIGPDAALPCPCGSGAPYGWCCAGLEVPDLPGELMWELLLAELDIRRFKRALASGEVPGHLLGLAAERWLMEDQPGRAIALLEPHFTGPGAEGLDERWAHALNILCDAYDRRLYGKKKRALLHRVRQHPCPGLRAAAWQRLCTIHLDEGAFVEAQLAFAQAQRAAPDAPGTAFLEIALLATQHEEALARDRALFWRHKLRRGGEADEDILTFLEQAGRDPQDALMTSQAGILDPRLLDLRGWIRAIAVRPLPIYALAPPERGTTPAPTSATEEIPRGQTTTGHYRSTPVPAAVGGTETAAGLPHPAPAPEGEICLSPGPALAALEQRWHRLYPTAKPAGLQLVPPPEAPHPWDGEEGQEAAWLGLLDHHPEAADSLDILDDLVTALYIHPDTALSWVRHTLLMPLLARAEAILARVLPADGPATLPWNLEENRPALRLLFRHHLLLMESGEEAAASLSLQTLLRLNPRDHHGGRADLMNLYLRQGNDAAALALSRCYPEDRLVDLVYGEVLALYRGGAPRRARQALRRALSRLPLIPRYLTRKRVARPPVRERSSNPASAETAWFYRESMMDVWSSVPGLLDWLKRQTG